MHRVYWVFYDGLRLSDKRVGNMKAEIDFVVVRGWWWEERERINVSGQ